MKHFIIIILMMVLPMIVSADMHHSAGLQKTINRFKKGDVNGDGIVNEFDIRDVVNIIFNNSQEDHNNMADVNEDGSVNVVDMIKIINIIQSPIKENVPNSLVLQAKDGTKAIYPLTEDPMMTFAGTDMVISSNSIEKKYAMNDIARITYEASNNTGFSDNFYEKTDGPNKEEKVFYVYRNDDDFNGFFYDHINGIVFSNVDLDGHQYPNHVIQEVWTVDSIYRIPIEFIDSVGFVQPPAIINSNVFTFTAETSSYLLHADTQSFILKTATPVELQPHVGNVVVSSYDCLSFPEGIMAKVISRLEQSDGIHYECEHATIDDIYDQIVYYGYGDIYNAQDENKTRTRAEARSGGILWDNSLEGTLNYSGTTSTVSSHTKGAFEVLLRKTMGKPMFARFIIGNNISTTFTFNARSKVDLKPEPVKIGKTLVAGKIIIPEFPAIWFEPQMTLFGYFEEKGSIDLDLSAHYRRHDKFQLTCSDMKWTFTHTTPVNESGIDVASLSMKGYAEIGLQPELMISLNGSKTGIGISTRFGLRETADFRFDALSNLDEGIYSSIKDSNTEESITLSGSIYAQIGIVDNCLRGDFKIPQIKVPISNHYLLPSFSDIVVEKDVDSHSATISCIPSRDILLPLKLGLGLYDKDGDLKELAYENDNYKYENKGFSIRQHFTSIELGKEYVAKPIIKMFDRDIPALPSEKFKLEEKLSCPDDNHPHMINLGLPSGTKWACCNVGASMPEGNGSYFAWGETKEKSVYKWENYLYGYYDYWGSPNDYSYLVNIGSDIAGTGYDAATANWGVPWRMPTTDQCSELINLSSTKLTKYNNVNGYIFTGPNGNCIFLPAAGSRYTEEIDYLGIDGHYWTSMISQDESVARQLVWLSGSPIAVGYFDRYIGYPIRPACKN